MREGYEVYGMYLEDLMDDVAAGKPVIIEVRNLSDFTRMVVLAKCAKDRKDLGNCQTLWLRDIKDEVIPEPWAIEILEELPDDSFKPKRKPPKRERTMR